MKTLWILRHAKAESGDALHPDEARSLNERGREACVRLRAYMQRKAYVPGLVLCSTAARTRETLSLIMPEGATWEARYEKKLYLATAGEMLAQVQLVEPAVESILLVGHNPGLHHLAALLASGDLTPLRQKLELKYPTGTLTMLRFDAADWRMLQPDSGELMDLVTPNEL